MGAQKMLRRLAYGNLYWKYYGLHKADIAHHEYLDEATRRLPHDLFNERFVRLVNASRLSANKTLIPESQHHSTADESVLLGDLIKEVQAEMDARESFRNLP